MNVTTNQQAILAAFDHQMRRCGGLSEGQPAGEDACVEREERITRWISSDGGWNGILWSDLDAGTADAVIGRQFQRFSELVRDWEWKHYSHDQPPDLPERLTAAGLVRQPSETLMVAELSSLSLDQAPPAGLEVRTVVDEEGVQALVRVHEQVFGEDYSATGRALLRSLRREPATAAGVVAFAGDLPVAAGRLELHLGTAFASLWGGGTLPEWRRRGAFRALVAHRAALAAGAGFRYLVVDARDESRPLLERHGFTALATTTPFTHAAPAR
jgi:hypothetical protein